MIAEGLAHILLNLPRWYEQLDQYSTFRRVFQATAGVFANIICYLVNAIQFLKQNKVRRAGKTITSNSKLEKCSARIKRADKYLACEIQVASGKCGFLTFDFGIVVNYSVAPLFKSLGTSFTADITCTNKAGWPSRHS